MSEFKLARRSRPDQLRYLAAKLREGDQWRESVAITLDALALELEAPERPKGYTVQSYGRTHNTEPGIRCWCSETHEPEG